MKASSQHYVDSSEKYRGPAFFPICGRIVILKRLQKSVNVKRSPSRNSDGVRHGSNFLLEIIFSMIAEAAFSKCFSGYFFKER
jgi:hypothetical protein